MPPKHRLNLPMLTVFNAALKASAPTCKMSSSLTGYSSSSNSATYICEGTTFLITR
ncbi:Uncharacterised protein [Mycobacteroides abscessus subsp. abscessus]|nr:Uncharacterised protein [Mycobacteroides abscessus subsp. abscessus]SKT87653.1 Uncharacterised protein [Mycobacteroides abscessus subsp. abscessus]